MKGFVRLVTLLLAAGVVVPPTLGALEVEQGRMRLVLHEEIGRFSLYYRPQTQGAAEVPLFVDRDPRTSGLSLLVGNRIYRLGDGGDFRQRAEKTPQGARFSWQSSQLEVTQEFRMSASRPDSVVVEISVTNLSAAALAVGFRLCLDTYLGESELSHFRTDRQADVERELTFRPADGVRYWASAPAPGPAKGTEAAVGLFSLTSGAGVTAPDRVVFANWKRLTEASWAYETSQTRNFNLVPYSINDSAVCQYYDPVPLAPRASRQAVLVVGNLSGLEAASEPAAVAAAEAAAAEATTAVPPAEGPRTLREELQLLDTLLQTLQSYLEPGAKVTDEDVRLMRETLSGIKNRTAEF